MSKIIVSGSREFNDSAFVFQAIDYYYPQGNIEIVSGLCRGPDLLGKAWAVRRGKKCWEFPANWERYGKRAGHIRNKEMGIFSDEALIFWDQLSKGTKDMISIMDELKKPYTIIDIRKR